MRMVKYALAPPAACIIVQHETSSKLTGNPQGFRRPTCAGSNALKPSQPPQWHPPSPRLDQALTALRTFKPSQGGTYEQCRVITHFDGTAQNPKMASLNKAGKVPRMMRISLLL